MLAAVADGLTHMVDHLPVEGGGGGAGGGHADGLDGLVDTQMVGLFILLAQAVGAVGDHHGGDAQTVNRFGVPEVQTGQEAALFLQRHLGNKGFNIHNNCSLYEK